MVDRRPGRWSLGFSCRQSVIGNEVLSNGSAHFGSPSDRHTQHLIDSPVKVLNQSYQLKIERRVGFGAIVIAQTFERIIILACSILGNFINSNKFSSFAGINIFG